MTTQDSGDKDHDYVCMKKIRHRKSCKKKKPVVRKVSVKVKRQRSIVKRKPSLHDKRNGRRGSVKKTKEALTATSQRQQAVKEVKGGQARGILTQWSCQYICTVVPQKQQSFLYLESRVQ